MIGLYIAYVIPIFLRWRKGDDFQPGPWNNGRKYRWMNSFATFWVGADHDHLLPPVHPAGGALERRIHLGVVQLRAADGGVVILLAWIGWMTTARKHFTGQVRETDIEKEIGPEPEVGPAAP